jgi:hypothetical protein
MLNVADIFLTMRTLSLGGRELNLVYSAAGSPLLMTTIKMLLVGVVILALVVFRRSRLLNWLNIGMALVVGWGIVALLSWSI